MTPAFLLTSRFLSLFSRLACWLLGHDFGRRSMHCLRCGVRCVEVTR
jgi:hypothetical protein